MLTNIVCLIKTIKRYDSLPIHACAKVLAVINRVERARSTVIVKHKYMLRCNHKIRINIMREICQFNFCRIKIFQNNWLHLTISMYVNSQHPPENFSISIKKISTNIKNLTPSQKNLNPPI